jgi:hypothetical protein
VTSLGVVFRARCKKTSGAVRHARTLGTAAGPPLHASHELNHRGAPERFRGQCTRQEKAGRQKGSQLAAAAVACSSDHRVTLRTNHMAGLRFDALVVRLSGMIDPSSLLN